jgi:hypothetical protein
MFATLAVVAAVAFAPAQPPTLKISNERVTYGELGATRPDNKLLPGDVFFVSFDIEGLKLEDTGKVSYSMSMEVSDKAGKVVFKQVPSNSDEYLPLGGTKMPARSYVTIGIEQAAGEYTCKITATDRTTKASATLEKKFEVLPKTFGIVGLYSTSDPESKYPIPLRGIAGQALWLHFSLVEFQRDSASKQPNLTVTMKPTLDGTSTLPKPVTLSIDKGVAENVAGLPLQILLPLNRVGKFVIELQATDNLSKKSFTLKFPVEVLPAQ